MQYNGLSFTECRFEGGHGKILRLGDNKLKLTRHQIWYPAGEFFFFTLKEEFTRVTAPVLGGESELSSACHLLLLSISVSSSPEIWNSSANIRGIYSIFMK